jgi:hypothetical protein
MIAPPPGVRVWLAAGVTDMRKSLPLRRQGVSMGLRPWCSSISVRIRSYVSGAIMWRRRRVVRDFAGTGGLSRHII